MRTKKKSGLLVLALLIAISLALSVALIFVTRTSGEFIARAATAEEIELQIYEVHDGTIGEDNNPGGDKDEADKPVDGNNGNTADNTGNGDTDNTDGDGKKEDGKKRFNLKDYLWWIIVIAILVFIIIILIIVIVVLAKKKKSPYKGYKSKGSLYGSYLGGYDDFDDWDDDDDWDDWDDDDDDFDF